MEVPQLSLLDAHLRRRHFTSSKLEWCNRASVDYQDSVPAYAV
jgi:hypothetical protein